MPAVAAKPRRYEAVEDGEFVVFEAVPVFKEHTNRDGVEMDAGAMERIAARCNERINETGDFPTVVLRHTDDEGERDPEVVGFAGPFRLGRIGAKNPKTAILADLRIYREDAKKVKKYPRLSVEYWADEADPTSGYFDPICLLGAETPELDLGVRYQRGGKGGQRVMRYQKIIRFQAGEPSVPSGTNTYVPGIAKAKPSKRPETFSKESTVALSPEDLTQIVEAIKPVVASAVAEAMQGGGAVGADPLAAAGPPDHYAKMCQYAKDDDEDGARSYLDGLDEDGISSLSDAIDADEDEGRREKLTKYMAPAMPAKSAPSVAAQYQRERDELRTKYRKVQADNRKLEEKVTQQEERLRALEGDRNRAVRYQKLIELASEGYAFDVEDEVEDCQSMDEPAFDKHVERIRSRYQRIPQGTLPMGGNPPLRGEGASRTDKKKAEKYAKRAREIVSASRAKGESITFEAAMSQAAAEDKDAA